MTDDFDEPSCIGIGYTADGLGYVLNFGESGEFVIRPPFAGEIEAQLPTPGLPLCEELSAASDCYRKSLSLLARREHSALQLRQKLMQRGFSSHVIDRVESLLREEDSISDRRFAEQWISARLSSHPEGETQVYAGLVRRGVDGSLAREAISDYLTENPDAFRTACLRYLLKLNRTTVTTEELLKKAKKRGFDKNIIAYCADEFYTYTGTSYADQI
jgi:regulatory protein